MPEKGEVELEGVNLTLGEVTKLATSPRGRLLLRQLPGCLTALLDMLLTWPHANHTECHAPDPTAQHV